VGTPAEVLTAETILTVFGAAVRVDRNPLSGKPQVVLAAGRSQGVLRWTERRQFSTSMNKPGEAAREPDGP